MRHISSIDTRYFPKKNHLDPRGFGQQQKLSQFEAEGAGQNCVQNPIFDGCHCWNLLAIIDCLIYKNVPLTLAVAVALVRGAKKSEDGPNVMK